MVLSNTETNVLLVALDHMEEEIRELMQERELRGDMWQERLEWYLNEFYQIAKTKTVGTTNRPERGSERIQENTETQGEESKS